MLAFPPNRDFFTPDSYFILLFTGFGNISFLGKQVLNYDSTQESIMRIESPNIANELIKRIERRKVQNIIQKGTKSKKPCRMQIKCIFPLDLIICFC
jgi:hypothetical protein